MSDAATGAPPPEPQATQPTRRRIPLYVLGVLVLVLGVWGARRYLYSRHHVSSDNAQVDGHITLIAPRIGAFISRVLVDDNQHVAFGDTLVVLDDRDLQVRLEQAEADLRAAEAAGGSRGRSGQAKSEFQASRAQAAFDAAAANLESARKQASAAGSQVSASGAAVRGADARLASAQAAVDNARLQLGYARITAPVSGIIAKRNAETGAMVQPGQSLMSIVPDSNVWVTANLKETQLTNVKVGDSVEFTVDAYPGRKFKGRVESLSPATGARFALLPPDNATGNFTKVVQRIPVKIAVQQPSDTSPPLRPGMSVDVDIATGSHREQTPGSAAAAK